ncbi:16369_t:CDS:1, partial [Acaulospora morrowiae]
ISESEEVKQILRYSGEDYLPGISTCNDIVTENDEGLTIILENALANHRD